MAPISRMTTLVTFPGASNFSVVKTGYTWAQISYFSRFNTPIKAKYLLTAAIRRDGSSRFGAQSKYGNFPSITGGWIISNEPFLKQQAWLDQLKLRASWGKAGNNQIGSYGALALVNPDNYVYGSRLLFGGGGRDMERIRSNLIGLRGACGSAFLASGTPPRGSWPPSDDRFARQIGSLSSPSSTSPSCPPHELLLPVRIFKRISSRPDRTNNNRR